MRSVVRQEVQRITSEFEEADRRHRLAPTLADREQAEAARREALGRFWLAGEELGDLLLLMLRYAEAHRPEALRYYLAELLRPERSPVTEAVVRLEKGRAKK
jgi:hypothetical protein